MLERFKRIRIPLLLSQGQPNTRILYAACMAIGAAVFLAVYGVLPLNVTDDGWIFMGYAEMDVTMHYAGWMQMRNSPWAWPLGLATNLRYPTGSIISFTDSIPLVSILLKSIRSILPETFQFFGWYTFLCFILQGLSAGMLTRHFTKAPGSIALSALLFTLSPVLLERSFRHTALSSHWLILFALYLYFKSREECYKKQKMGLLVLHVLAVAIHPYFLPMLMGILVATLFEQVLHNRKVVRPLLFLFSVCACTLAVGYAIGALGWGNASASGFGYFSMNLNAPYNPTSLGYEWSNFLKTLPQTLGNYDGFNYLGLGVLAALLCIFVCRLGSLPFTKPGFFLGLLGLLKRNLGMVLACAVFFLFSISNVITFNDKILLEYPLPNFILYLCNIFRASSRMFYPVFYLVFLSVIVYIVRKVDKKHAACLLSLLIVVQVVDIWPALQKKHAHFHSGPIIAQTGFETPEWTYILENTDKIISINPVLNIPLSALAAKHHIKNNLAYSNRAQFNDGLYNAFQSSVLEKLKNGEPMEEGAVYLTDDRALYDELCWRVHDSLMPCDLGAYMLFVPTPPEGSPLRRDQNLLPKDAARADALTNDTFHAGVSQTGHAIVFRNTDMRRDLLLQAQFLRVGEYTVRVMGAQLIENGYRIQLDMEPEADLAPFAHPAPIQMVGPQGA